MSALFEFMGTHWLMTLVLVAPFLFFCMVIGALIRMPFELMFKAYNRRLRSKNIAARGWPPSHLDADGDFKPVEKP